MYAIASSFMPSMKCVPMRSFAEPEKDVSNNRESNSTEPTNRSGSFALTIRHERCDDPQLVVGDEGGSVRHYIGMAEEFRDMKLPLKAMAKLRSQSGMCPASKWQSVVSAGT